MTHPDQQAPRLAKAWLLGAGALAVAAAAVGIRLAVTSGDDDPVATPAAVAAATASVPPSASATASAKPSPKPASRLLKLGQKFRFERDEYVVDLAVLKVKHGDDYEGVQVRVCNRGPDVTVSRLPWSLGYDKFEQLHDIDISGGGLAEPAYEDRDLTDGDCAKGWINYTRIEGQKPDGIQYAVEGAEPVRWRF